MFGKKKKEKCSSKKNVEAARDNSKNETKSSASKASTTKNCK